MIDVLTRAMRLSPDAVESAVGDQTVILHLGQGTYYGLDPVGTRIWELMKDGTAAAEICRILADEYDVDLSTIEDDARKFLTDLEGQGLLVSV